MQLHLGVDLGTTFSAAAVARDRGPEIVTFGHRSPTVPSVLYLRDDLEFLHGEHAARRALTEPLRVAREFKRRVGDPTPVHVARVPYGAHILMGVLAAGIVAEVEATEGRPVDRLALTHPANWGSYKRDLLVEGIDAAGISAGIVLLTEPEAAARWYASTERLDVGSVVCVYDLGGGTFDATILRKEASGFTILGEPKGIDRLGGLDFDEAVFRHVLDLLGDAVGDLDPDDPVAAAAVARLRQDCTEAKEALSSDTDARIPVLLPGLHTEVRLTRTELEELIGPAIDDTVAATVEALGDAGLDGTDLTAVLLVGGSSRIPLVAQRISAALGRPIAIDAHPKHSVALGAALAAADGSLPSLVRGSGGAVDAPVDGATRVVEIRPGTFGGRRTTLGRVLRPAEPPKSPPVGEPPPAEPGSDAPAPPPPVQYPSGPPSARPSAPPSSTPPSASPAGGQAPAAAAPSASTPPQLSATPSPPHPQTPGVDRAPATGPPPAPGAGTGGPAAASGAPGGGRRQVYVPPPPPARGPGPLTLFAGLVALAVLVVVGVLIGRALAGL